MYETRRDVLLDAAGHLFVEKGMAATTIDDIVARAGVAKGTFYHYFKDRAAMIDALRERYVEHFLAAAETAVAARPEGDWTGRLAAWLDTTVRGYLSSYALHDVLFHEPTVTHRHPMGQVPIVRHLAALLADGAAAGVWDVEDDVATAVVIFHGLHGVVDEAIVTGGDTTDIARRAAKLFAKMVRRD